MSSWRGKIFGSLVSRYFPGLRYYLADPVSRKNLRVRVQSGWIDIIDSVQSRAIRIARANAVYLLDMINSFDYYFNSAMPIPVKIKGQIFKIVDFSTPRFQKIHGFDDFPVMCSSVTEPFVTTQEYLDHAGLQPGQTVIDLGSYSGLTSIAFSKAVGPSGKVIALEPDPQNFSTSQINLAQHAHTNHLNNVTLINAAISDRRGKLTFSAEGSMGASATSVVGTRGDVTEVNCLTLDDIMSSQSLPKVDFVKMDIEGFEEAVLRGSADFFNKYRPKIIIESHVVAGVLTEKSITEILQKYGYTCSTVGQSGISFPLVVGTPAGR